MATPPQIVCAPRERELVDLIGVVTIAPMRTTGITSPNPALVRPWTRPLPAIQQDIIQLPQATAILKPQLAYVEMMARRKALYMLPALDTVLFELVDGSGAFNLNMIWLPAAGSPGPIPTTVSAMRCVQGAALRNWLLPLTGPTAGP